MTGARNPLTGTKLNEFVATHNRYSELIDYDDDHDNDHDHASEQLNASIIPSTLTNTTAFQSDPHNVKKRKPNQRQRQRRKEISQPNTTTMTTHNTKTRQPLQSPQLDVDDEAIRDAAAANQIFEEDWLNIGSQQHNNNHDHTTTTRAPQQNQRAMKRTIFAQQFQRVHYCTHDITAHDHNAHNVDGSRDLSAHYSSTVACSVHCHPHSSTRGCNWSTSSGFFVGAVPHCAQCLHEQTPVGEDGREVMSLANASPLTELGLVPRPPVLNAEAGGYHSVQEHVRAPPNTSYMTIYNSPKGGTIQRPRGELNVAEGTDPNVSGRGSKASSGGIEFWNPPGVRSTLLSHIGLLV